MRPSAARAPGRVISERESGRLYDTLGGMGAKWDSLGGPDEEAVAAGPGERRWPPRAATRPAAGEYPITSPAVRREDFQPVPASCAGLRQA